jgi:hypothetical protein
MAQATANATRRMVIPRPLLDPGGATASV